MTVIHSLEQLNYILHHNKGPFKIIGGGSNILLTRHITEHLLINRIQSIDIIEEDNHTVLIAVGGGENWHEFVRWCVLNDYGGIENLSLIPGTVGAAPIQNIGAYGVEQDKVFDSLEAIDLASGNTLFFTREDCDFGYRDSIFKKKYKGKIFITKVYYRLTKIHELVLTYGDVAIELSKQGIVNPTIVDVSDVIIKIRKAKLPDPLVVGNSGSFFKNPIVPDFLFEKLRDKFPNMPGYLLANNQVKIPAGWLIDQCGWKGKAFGNTGTYKNQALVLVNNGGANGQEVYRLATKIMASVIDKYEILLIPEVNIW